MYCKRCGAQIPDDSTFCMRCGLNFSVNTSQPYRQNPTVQQYPNSYQNQQNNIPTPPIFSAQQVTTNVKKKKSKKPIIIAVIVFFLIGGIGVALSEDQEYTTTTAKNKTTSSAVTTTVLSAEEKASIEASEFEEEHGVPEKLYNSIVAACKEIGINEVDYLYKEDDWANGERFSLSYKGFEFVVYLNRDRTINSINSGTTKYYESGKAVRNVNDHIYTNDQKIQVKIWAEDAVTAKLKAPSTATFAKYDEWSYSRDKDVFTAVAYVDAQNGFGAMIRSNFVVKIKWDGESTQGTVLSVDIS